MSLSARLDLINKLQIAERRHAPRAHIRRDLVDLTTRQIQAECRDRFPVGIIAVCAVVAAAIITVLLVIGVTR